MVHWVKGALGERYYPDKKMAALGKKCRAFLHAVASALRKKKFFFNVGFFMFFFFLFGIVEGPNMAMFTVPVWYMSIVFRLVI